MVALADSQYLDKLILNQRRAIRYYVLFAVGLVALGLIIIAIAFITPYWLSPDSPIIPDTFKGLFGIGGAFVSSLSAFQVKEILNKTEKIQALKLIKEKMNNLEGISKAESIDSQERLDDLIWKILEKAVLS